MYFIVFSFALIRPPLVLTTTAFTCFGIAALACIFSLALDVKNQRREREAGKNVIWYKRTTLYSSGGGLCFILSETLNLLIANDVLPPTLFFFILIAFLIMCGLCSAIYSLKLALHQRKLAFEQLRNQHLK